MRIFSHDDPELQPFKELISGYTAREDSQGIPYWVFIDDFEPIGIVSVGKEPVQLLEPLGTPFSMIQVVDPERNEGVMREFISQALRISMDNEGDYVSTNLPAKYRKLAGQFREFGFRELANTYRMVCKLDGSFEPSNTLRFDRVERSEFSRFVDLTIEFMSGSPDRGSVSSGNSMSTSVISFPRSPQPMKMTISASAHFASWCWMTVFPAPNGPGTHAVPPLPIGKNASITRCPVTSGSSGVSLSL